MIVELDLVSQASIAEAFATIRATVGDPEVVMNPVKIAEAFYYLHTQDQSCWTHELQLTPFATKPSF